MRNQAVLYFVIGALSAIIIMGGGLVALHSSGEDAEAQGTGTWQTKIWPDSVINNGFTEPDPETYIDDWLAELPIECDIVFQAGSGNLLFYRCP